MAESSNKCPIGAFNSSKHTFNWKIEKISELRAKVLAGSYCSIESPVFEATLSDEAKTMTKWLLILRPVKVNYDYVFEIKLLQLSDVHVDFTASISVMGFGRYDRKRLIVERQRKLFVERECHFKCHVEGDYLNIVFEIEIIEASMPISSMIHHKQFFKDMDHLYLDQTNNYDVTLTCGEKVFYCHKGILSARSPVFKAMFQSNMKENESGTVEIEDIQQEVVLEFLQYIYTGTISLNFEKYGEELFAVADKYQVDQLKGACENEMISKLDAENCIEMLLLGDRYKARNLKKSAVDFFNKNKEKFDSFDWKLFSEDQPTIVIEVMECLLKNKI